MFHALGNHISIGFIFAKRRIKQSFNLLIHIKPHLLMTFLFTSGSLKFIANKYPLIGFKYLGDYLSISLSRSSRLEIFSYHYKSMNRLMSNDGIVSLIDGPVELWKKHVNDDTHTIEILFADYVLEGDLSLILKTNGELIYTYSFTFAPGASLNIYEEIVLFISRSQAAGGNQDLFHRTTNNLNHICPRKILLEAVQAIAISLGIPALAGIAANEQISSNKFFYNESARKDYEWLWQEHRGIAHVSGGYYIIPLPLAQKPISEIVTHHRARAKKRRQVRQEIRDQVCLSITNNLLKYIPETP